jgi:hypothetical protein
MILICSTNARDNAAQRTAVRTAACAHNNTQCSADAPCEGDSGVAPVQRLFNDRACTKGYRQPVQLASVQTIAQQCVYTCVVLLTTKQGRSMYVYVKIYHINQAASELTTSCTYSCVATAPNRAKIHRCVHTLYRMSQLHRFL